MLIGFVVELSMLSLLNFGRTSIDVQMSNSRYLYLVLQVLKVLKGHSHRVWGVAISADGGKIVSGSFDETVRVWSTETGEVCLLDMKNIIFPHKQEYQNFFLVRLES